MKKRIKGLSLIEVLVVVGVFAILSVIITRSVFLTLRGSAKSETQVKVRENINYALSVMERGIRNADSIADCPNPDTKVLNYTDSFGVNASFSCVGIGEDDSYIASSSARLTSSEIKINSCVIECTQEESGLPPKIIIDLVAADAKAMAVNETNVSVSTQIFLRTY
ncbi:type II secretion system protein J [Patescibacteria group bacterium]